MAMVLVKRPLRIVSAKLRKINEMPSFKGPPLKQSADYKLVAHLI